MHSPLFCIFALGVLATACGAHARQMHGLPSHRALLALSVFDICNGSPQEVSNTLTQTLVSGSGSLASTDARAIVQAGNWCCDKLKLVLATAQASATSAGNGKALSAAAARAASQAGLTGCAKDAFASVTTSASVTPSSGQAMVATNAVSSGSSSSESSVGLTLNPSGGITAQSEGSVNLG